MITALLALSCLVQDDDDQLTPAKAREQLEMIHRLMSRAEELLNDAKPPSARRSEDPQKRTLDELDKLLKAAHPAGNGRPDRRPSREDAEPVKPEHGADPYGPKRNGQPDSVFRSRHDRDGWNPALPKKIRDAMLSGMRHIDEYPAEYAELLREYFENFGK